MIRCVDIRGNMMKKIKLFLSSTFDDEASKMRAIFKTKIMTKLNRIVAESMNNAYLFDYEVGIPKNSPMSMVVDTCLETIDDCDIFVGLLCRNYGTVLGDFQDLRDYSNVSQNYTQIVDDTIKSEHSFLEMEINYALQNEMKCIFFRIDYDESCIDKRLEKLINKIKDNGTPVIDVSSLSFMDEVLQYIIQVDLLDIKFTDKIMLSKDIRYLVANKLRYYTENKKFDDAINSYLMNTTTYPLVINGTSGIGKTTLLLGWINSSFIPDHYQLVVKCVGYPYSNISYFIKSTLFSLFEDNAEIKQEIASISNQELLVNSFPVYLKKLPCDKNYFIVLDGIDSLAVDTFNYKEYWIPKEISENIKLIFTTSSSFDSRDYKFFEISAPNTDDQIQTIHYYEGKFHELNQNEEYRSLINFKLSPMLYRLIILGIFKVSKYHNISEILKRYNKDLINYNIEQKSIYIINDYIDFLEEHYGLELVRSLLLSIACMRNISTDLLRKAFKNLEFEDVLFEIDTIMVFFAKDLICLNNKVYRNVIIKRYDQCELSKIADRFVKFLCNDSEISSKEKLHLVKVFYMNCSSVILLELLVKDNFVNYLFKRNKVVFSNVILKLEDEHLEFLNLHVANVMRLVSPEYYELNAQIYEIKGKYNEAIKASEILIENNELQPLEKIKVLENIARCYLLMNRYEEAIVYNYKAIEIKSDKPYYTVDLRVLDNNKIAYLLIFDYRFYDAISLMQETMNMMKGIYHKKHHLYFECNNNMAIAYNKLGLVEEAGTYYEKMLEIAEISFSNNYKKLATAYHNYGKYLYKQGLCNKALPLMRKTLCLYLAIYGKGHIALTKIYNSIANMFLTWGKGKFSYKYFKLTWDIMSKSKIENYELTQKSMESWIGLVKTELLMSHYLGIYDFTLYQIELMNKQNLFFRDSDAPSNLARLFEEYGYFEVAIGHHKIALKIINGDRYSECGIWSLVSLAELNLRVSDFEQAKIFYEEYITLKVGYSFNDELEKIMVQIRECIILACLGENDGALKMLVELYMIAEKISDFELLVKVRICECEVQNIFGEYELSLKILNGIEIEELKNNYMIAKILRLQWMNHQKLGDNNIAHYYLNKTIQAYNIAFGKKHKDTRALKSRYDDNLNNRVLTNQK